MSVLSLVTNVRAPAVEAASPAVVPRPLAVDLDQTLVRTDTLHEALLALAFRRPAGLVGAFLALRHGRAAFKSAVMERAPLDFSALPYDDAVLQLIADRTCAGGEVRLVTAADQKIADGVAAHLGLFPAAVGSDGRRNLKGPAKADYLAAEFPDGFDYIGDCAADLPVWRRAGSALVAGGTPSLTRQLAAENLSPTVLPRRSAGLRSWVKALRLHQWSKNALLFVPLLLSREFDRPGLLLEVAVAFLLFGMVASATYLINDLSDLAADRKHSTKRFRALAAGLIPISTAVPLALVLLAGGLAGAFLLHPGFGAATAAYATLTLCYSFWLKRIALVDVAAIAALFAVRITAGMVIVGHAVSYWLVTFTAVLFLSLALAKRTTELVQAARTLKPVAGRGYLPGDEPLTLTLGIAAGMVSVIVMVLYMTADAMPTGLYASRGPLLMIPAVLGLWLMRIWLLAHRGTLNDDPVVYALRDRGSWCFFGIVVALWLAASLGIA